jgi:hypothetical protein
VYSHLEENNYNNQKVLVMRKFGKYLGFLIRMAQGKLKDLLVT